ncbi:MAG TPA: selenide, water dikinase SelD, partial [Candidatus Dormibacteraeota bacterium]|nr:selenide, water dikinase SelD [Candidatus Dormibacteraeota bacterium]
ADPARLLRKDGAAPGDVLVLTKPLGTGLILSGRRSGAANDACVDGAVASMLRLNRRASEILVDAGVRGATDVTGFGLLGHAGEMARASGTRFLIESTALPALPGALELVAEGIETTGARDNRRSVDDILDIGDLVEPARLALALDPQTSGGLLAAIPRPALEDLLERFAAAGIEASVVGRVETGPRGPGLAIV